MDEKMKKIVEKIGEDGVKCIENYLLQALQQKNEVSKDEFSKDEKKYLSDARENYTKQTEQNFNDKGLLNSILGGNFNFNSQKNEMFKGILIGAGITYILTNENAQKAIFSAFAKVQNMLSVGLEEMRERFEDAKAELEENI